MKRTLIAAIAAAIVLATAGCSSEQVYSAAQTWQRNECYKINDAAERHRCLASNSGSYDDYQRQAEATRRAASSSAPAARSASAPSP